MRKVQSWADYDLIIGEQYSFKEAIETMSIDERLDEISMRGTVQVVLVDGSPNISPGDSARIVGLSFDTGYPVSLLHPAVVWESLSTTTGRKHLNVTMYDKTIYLSKSEDEMYFPAGQTASERLTQICLNWGIPVSNIPDTGVKLATALRRSQTIWSMVMSDLKETATAGGDCWRPRMTPQGLELYKIGSNNTVWMLETDVNIERMDQTRTLEGAVTKAKVVGSANSSTQLAPVLSTQLGDVAQYGTLQKIISDTKIKNASQAALAGQDALTGMQWTVMIEAIDINTIRAGDAVNINGMNLIVTSVNHTLGVPGMMSLDIAPLDYVRRQFYHEYKVN